MCRLSSCRRGACAAVTLWVVKPKRAFQVGEDAANGAGFEGSESLNSSATQTAQEGKRPNSPSYRSGVAPPLLTVGLLFGGVPLLSRRIVRVSDLHSVDG